MKAVPKREAHEKVGVIGKKQGKYEIIEYSELPLEIAEETLEDGRLKFNHGHILVIVIESDFLLDIACGKDSKVNQMYHRAHKKISHVDPESG